MNKWLKPSYLKKVYLESNGIVGNKVDPVHYLPKLISWIEKSFEVTPDGGSAAYYSPFTGWKASYPETTGYLIPTLLDYYRYTGDTKYLTIAKKAGDWLISIQLPEGGWQGLQVDQQVPARVFNSGMILDGLTSLYLETNEERYKDSAEKGLNWIVSCMDQEGVFTHNNLETGGAYDLLVLGCCFYADQLFENRNRMHLLNSLEAHKNKFLSDKRFIPGCNFQTSYPNTMLLHHIGYTLDGLLICGEILEDDNYFKLVKSYAIKLLSKFEVNQGLPAYLKKNWDFYFDLGGNKYSHCLTGYAQIAIVFFKLAAKFEDLRFRNAALKILDLVCAMSNRKYLDKGLSFGVAGSYPFNGNYQKNQVVNWAGKYLAEAILASESKTAGRKIQL